MSSVRPHLPGPTPDRLHARRARLYGAAYVLLAGPPTSQAFHTLLYRLGSEVCGNGGPCARLRAALGHGGAPELRREYAALFGARPPDTRFHCRRGQRAPCIRAYQEVSAHVAESGPVEDLATLARLAVESAYAVATGNAREAERLARLEAEFLRSAGGCVRHVARVLQRDGGFVYRQLGACLVEQLHHDRHLLGPFLHHRSAAHANVRA